MRLLRAASAAGLFAALLLPAGCGADRPPEFRIGLIELTGGPLVSFLGEAGVHGATLAVDELNAAGGIEIGGVKHVVRLVRRQTEPRPDAASTAATALVNVDSVDVVIAPLISAHAAPALAVTQAAGVPAVAPMASNPTVTANRPLAFRLAFTDAFQGTLLATFAYDSLGIRRVATLADPASSYAQDVIRLFRETFEARGGRTVASEGFAADGALDFRQQMRRIVAAHPDAILLPNYMAQDSVQMRQARELGFKGRFLGSDSWDPAAIVHVPHASGSIVIANWDPRTPRAASQAFVALYAKHYEGTPRTAAAATYDAVQLFALAAARAGSRDGDAIAAKLRTFGPHVGASADFDFRGLNDPVRGGVVIEVRGGDNVIRTVSAPER